MRLYEVSLQQLKEHCPDPLDALADLRISVFAINDQLWRASAWRRYPDHSHPSEVVFVEGPQLQDTIRRCAFAIEFGVPGTNGGEVAIATALDDLL